MSLENFIREHNAKALMGFKEAQEKYGDSEAMQLLVGWGPLLRALAFADILNRIKMGLDPSDPTAFEVENERRRLADEPPYFFGGPDGSLGAKDVIPFEFKRNRRVTDARILELYFENLTPNEIAKECDRPLARVLKALARFGIHLDRPHKRRFSQQDLPYGWSAEKEKLIPNDTEQWVLGKIASDLDAKKSPEEIAKELNGLGLKFRGIVWHTGVIERAVRLNGSLLSSWKKGALKWKEIGSAESPEG